MSDVQARQLTRNGTADPHSGASRVYGGDSNLVHVPDGQRAELGKAVAEFVDNIIRAAAALNMLEKPDDGAVDVVSWPNGPICPGCAMIVLFNASIEMAEQNGQPVKELAKTMANAYQKLADNPETGVTEEIEVILDCD